MRNFYSVKRDDHLLAAALCAKIFNSMNVRHLTANKIQRSQYLYTSLTGFAGTASEPFPHSFRNPPQSFLEYAKYFHTVSLQFGEIRSALISVRKENKNQALISPQPLIFARHIAPKSLILKPLSFFSISLSQFLYSSRLVCLSAGQGEVTISILLRRAA